MQNLFFSNLINTLEECKSETTKWLESLPIYDCPFCGQETIFASGCAEDCHLQESED